jgi:hypothetical protein
MASNSLITKKRHSYLPQIKRNMSFASFNDDDPLADTLNKNNEQK